MKRISNVSRHFVVSPVRDGALRVRNTSHLFHCETDRRAIDRQSKQHPFFLERQTHQDLHRNPKLNPVFALEPLPAELSL